MKNNIKALLVKAGMTQKDLANKTGLSESRISRYINTNVLLKYYLHMQIIADCLGVWDKLLFTPDEEYTKEPDDE